MNKVVTNPAVVNLLGKSPPNKGKLANYTAASTRNSTDRPVPTGPMCEYINANGDMQKL